MASAEAETAEFGATMGFAFLAADFCLLPETFPVFMAWVNSKAEPVGWTTEKLDRLRDNLRGLSQMAYAAAMEDYGDDF